MESRMEESILNHSVAISRIEDCEDDMNICKNDVDMLKLEQGVDGRDIQMLEVSMGWSMKNWRTLGVGWMVVLPRVRGLPLLSRATLGSWLRSVVDRWRFVSWPRISTGSSLRINEVIDKKMVRQDEELDRVVGLVGEKIDTKMGEFSSNLMEALEIEENRRKDLEAKVLSWRRSFNSLNHTVRLGSTWCFHSVSCFGGGGCRDGGVRGGWSRGSVLFFF
jgi:hypothetical protein